MKQLTVIKNDEQYIQYCNEIEQLLSNEDNNQEQEDRIELLEVLIEDWDRKNFPFPELIPPKNVK